ncbi:tetratricopeptide repeat-containing sensor histidine kinase [Chitinophaga pinensis]|uniref:histidine kinase n=1 Tax=Chitinophaga pinensis (strain ATCC 43595 / DSM 2588 / LMG 13176 / NBRC 15968 / NCIMB 11800 / UQM 2034) TaxID=485918 RepID=A0A979GX95_CHIPD|nr:histidine kinase dimerization/phosphoacceptor domain -containing protein [Chitinophaga pinensis]ACU62286.1 signal transduction histidine kinase [Chitinophaga pinensis DSM 2588]
MSGIRYILSISFLLLTVCGRSHATVFLSGEDERSAAIATIHTLWQQGDRILAKPHPLTADCDSAKHISQKMATLSRRFNYDQGLGLSQQLMSAALRYNNQGNEAIAYAMEAVDILSKAGTEKQKADAFIELAGCYSNADTDLPVKISLYEKGARSYHQLGDKVREAALLEMIGDLYQLKKDYTTALSRLKQSLALYQSAGFQRLQGVYALIGTVCNEQNNFVEGLRYNMLAVQTGEQVKDTSQLMATVYHRLGMSYHSINYTRQALEYYKKALLLAYQLNDSAAVQNYQLNIAELFIKTGKYKESIDTLNVAVNYHPITEADDLSYVYRQYLRLYLALHDYHKANTWYQKILQLYNSDKASAYEKTVSSAYLSLYLVETGRFREAATYLNSAATQQISSVQGNAMLERLRYRTDSALGNLAGAIAHFQQYTVLSDSLNSVAQTRQLGQLQLQFETEEKDKDILLLTQKSQLQASSLEKEIMIRYLIIGGILVLIVFLVLVYNRYRSNKRTNIKLEGQQLEINEQNETLKALLDEKEWLLKEIHHRVKNNLQIIISLLNTQSQYLNNEDALAAIRNSQQRMYSMSLIHQRLYQTENLGKIDMNWYIPEMITYIRDSLDTNAHITFKVDSDHVALDVAEAVPLGLILNEAVSNALKYAFPHQTKGNIEISFKATQDGNCFLDISDNGVGIPEGKNIAESASLGMSLMQGLSLQLDGTFTLSDNHPGVSITVAFRCKEFISNENIHTHT